MRHLLRRALSGEKQTSILAASILRGLVTPSEEVVIEEARVADRPGLGDVDDASSTSSADEKVLDLTGENSSDNEEEDDEGGAPIEISKRYSSSCKSASSTRQARCRAVFTIVGPHRTAE